MFPEITRDEVFRIETRHLWLRWPVIGDATVLAAVLRQSCRDAGARIAEANPMPIKATIAGWRTDMERGSALHLALAPKHGAEPIGIIHAGADATLRCRIGPDDGLRPLGAEAIEVMRFMITWLGITAERRRDRPMAQQPRLPHRPEFATWCMQA